MFSSRNIHLAILGIILGASAGYVAAFYKANSALAPPPLSPNQSQNEMPANHPSVNNEQMLDAMKKAVETDPSNPEIVSRYAMALFDAGHFAESEQWFKKAVDLEPNSVEARTMYGAVLWRTQNNAASEAQLQAALRIDSRNIPALHLMTVLALEKRDAAQAEKWIKQIESVEPTYGQLNELRTRLQAISGK
jgi:cytochrome c-type biogenesis protein CcmH/NrfG